MRIAFNKPTEITEVTKHATGVKPIYAEKSSTSQGDVWCTCGECVGSLLQKDSTVVGWIDTVCGCGNQIDFSEAAENL